MTNTMADLRQKVAGKLRETLHGREIDTYEKGKPELPHMLGIVTIGAISTDKAEKGTLLDPSHRFWRDYYEQKDTKNGVKKEIETAIHSLKEDNILQVTSPYGDDAGILYIEVKDINNTQKSMTVTCAECGEMIKTSPEISHGYGRYELIFRLNCPECEFSGVLESSLQLRKDKE